MTCIEGKCREDLPNEVNIPKKFRLALGLLEIKGNQFCHCWDKETNKINVCILPVGNIKYHPLIQKGEVPQRP